MIGHGRVVLIGGGVPIWMIDYSALALSNGSNSATINAALAAVGLSETRASVATVQTSASTVVTSGIAANDARIGDAGYGRGFVFEESRTNYDPWGRAGNWGAGGSLNVETFPYGVGPDGNPYSWRHQVQSGGFSRYLGSSATILFPPYTTSLWLRSPDGGGTLTNQIDYWDLTGNRVAAVTTEAWGRFSRTNPSGSTTNGLLAPADGRDWSASGGIAAGARDVVSDMHQFESGGFRTEYITTGAGAAVSRAAGRHLLDAASRIVSAGRVGLSFRTIPKGSIGGSNNYSANPYLWQYDASNYATIDATTGTVTVVIAGSSYTTASGMTAAIGDVLDYWIEAGGGAMQTVVKARKNNGSVTTLGTSGSPQGTVPSAGGIDLFSNSGAAGHFTAWHQSIKAFASGQRDAWAV